MLFEPKAFEITNFHTTKNHVQKKYICGPSTIK